MIRKDRRAQNKLRKIKVTQNYIEYAEGSCLIELGSTKIICTASVEEKVPPFLKGSNTGWITAEYSMLPRSCLSRTSRESTQGKVRGRTHEIQRLIGRSLRAVVDLGKLGERTIWIDCDVVQADGGTRCASITGGFIALANCLRGLKKDKVISHLLLKDFVAALSVGILDGHSILDLSYEEDSRAEVDMNVVMTGKGEFIEIQGTAEGAPFSKADMDKLLSLAKEGIEELVEIQKEVLNIKL